MLTPTPLSTSVDAEPDKPNWTGKGESMAARSDSRRLRCAYGGRLNHARSRDVPVTKGRGAGRSHTGPVEHTIQLGPQREGMVTSLTRGSVPARRAGDDPSPRPRRNPGRPEPSSPPRGPVTPRPVRYQNAHGRVGPRGVLAVIGIGALAVIALWWHGTPDVSGLGGWLTGAGEILGPARRIRRGGPGRADGAAAAAGTRHRHRSAGPVARDGRPVHRQPGRRARPADHVGLRGRGAHQP